MKVIRRAREECVGLAASSLFSNVAFARTLTIGQEDAANVKVLLEQMAREYGSQERFGRYQVLRHLLGILLIKLERARWALFQKESKLTGHRDDLFESFITLLVERFRTSHRVSQYAAGLNTTPRQLSETLRHFLGKTTKQVIDERLMLEAKWYLKHTNLSIKEIAYALGCQEASYFGRVFKRNTGVAPHAYR